MEESALWVVGNIKWVILTSAPFVAWRFYGVVRERAKTEITTTDAIEALRHDMSHAADVEKQEFKAINQRMDSREILEKQAFDSLASSVETLAEDFTRHKDLIHPKLNEHTERIIRLEAARDAT